LRGPAYHQRLLPAHTHLKFRQAGQGGDADTEQRDLAAELLAAEAAHFAKKNGKLPPTAAQDDDENGDAPMGGVKRALEAGSQAGGEEDPEAKRRRILEESRDIDADESEEDDESEDDSSDSDSDDEDAELQRELLRVRQERQEKREREVRITLTFLLLYCLSLTCSK
jgi:protein CWC15